MDRKEILGYLKEMLQLIKPSLDLSMVNEDTQLVSDLGLALRLVSETDAVMIDARDNEIYRRLYANNNYRFIPIRDYPRCKTGWIKRKALPLSAPAQEYIELLTEKAALAD